MAEDHNDLPPRAKNGRGRWHNSCGQASRRKRNNNVILDACEIPIEKLTYLNNNKIYWIRSRSGRHFVCQACGIPLPSLSASMRHSNLSSHDDSLAIDSVRPVLLHLPDIAPVHREVLNETLESAMDGTLADEDEVHRRQLIAEDLMTALRARIPNLKITGIGSTWDGLTLVDSSVEFNVDRMNFDSESSLSDDTRTEVKKPCTMTAPFDSFSHSSGLGYLLAEVFDFLRSYSADAPSESTSTQNDASVCESTTSAPSSMASDSVPHDSSCYRILSEFHSVKHTNFGSFCITFFDSKNVRYRITTGNRSGRYLSKLISTYFLLSQQARNLAIIFLKFSSLAHLDLPGLGTFYPPVLPLLVIFYLQHTNPPLLPNLHRMYVDHKANLAPDAFCHVMYNEVDLSFVTDASFVSKNWTDASDFSTGPDLADLWLGLLRFYVFDFQKSKCAVNIVSPNPVPRRRGSGRTSSISVMDPFDPNRDLCSPVNSNGFEYIHAQLVAAYAYFGIPRLDTGRHLFTKVRTREPQSPPAESYFNCFQPNDAKAHPTTSTKQQLTGPLRLTPVIDDGDQFESNLTKINSLFAAKFSIVFRELNHGSRRTSEFENCDINNPVPEPVRTLPIETMIPHILRFVLEEVLEPEDASAIVKRCMLKSLGCDKLPIGTCLTSVQFQYLTAMFARAFWSKICTLFINRGQLLARPRPFSKVTCLIFRACLLQYWNCHLATSSPTSPVDLCEASLLCAANDPLQSKPTDCEAIENDSHDAELDNEYEGDMFYEGDTQDDCTHYAMCDYLQMETQDSPNEADHSASQSPCEFAEQTLDFGDGDDVCIELSDQVSTVVANSTLQNSSIVQSNSSDKRLETVESRTSLTETLMDSAGLSSQIPPCSDAETNSAAIIEESTASKRRKKRARRDALIKKQNSDPDTKDITWETVIMSRDSVNKPLDDTRPGFYNKRLVDSLRKEDLSFPFKSTCHILGTDCTSLRTSVLGLVVPGKPSTMLAHFLAPLPQCKACGQLGHCQAECANAADKSVSFGVWKRLANDLPTSASEEQHAALSATLLELSRFHDCTYLEETKHFIVGILQSLLSKRFPTVRLQLFGSCANGFELPSSDLDLCVFFPRDSLQYRQLLNDGSTVKLIREFRSELLRSSRLLQIVHIRAILNAKVPILKVRFENGFEADISFSNYLALVNTRMLKLYTVIDCRLRVLGIALKIIGKLCHIGNASVGGVSSYALVIMLIHYLQQKDQLPVLQQLYEGSIKPVCLVNGWDAWFQEDLSIIRRLWTPPQNSMTLGELWLGFFHYFLFEFDRDVNVVCIRQKKVLPRFVKMWDSLFAVEDPFNLDHNLTGSLRRDSLLCILDVFYAVLVHHTTTLPGNMPLGEWRYKLFSPSCLATKQHHSPPPRSKCQRCHEFGHRAADCPSRDRRNFGIAAQSAGSHVDLLVGHFLAKDSEHSPYSPYLGKSPFNFLSRNGQVLGPQTPEPCLPMVNHVRFSNSLESLSSQNIIPRPHYPVFSNYTHRPRPNMVHLPHPQPILGQTSRPVMQPPRVPVALTAYHTSGRKSEYPVPRAQTNNPQSNQLEEVNSRGTVVSPPYPEVRMQQSPTVRIQRTPAARMQHTPATRMQQTPTARMQQASAVRMQQPPAARIQQTPALQTCQSPVVRTQQSPPSQMHQPSAVRMQQSPPSRMHQPSVIRMQQSQSLQMQQPPAIRMQKSPAIRMSYPLSNDNTRVRHVNGPCIEHPSIPTPSHNSTRRRRRSKKTALPDSSNGSHPTEPHGQSAGEADFNTPNPSRRTNARNDPQKRGARHQLTSSDSLTPPTAQKTRVKGCFTRSTASPRISNPPDVDLSIRFRNMSTHPV